MKCTACNGSGYYDHNGSPPCTACMGKGYIEPKELEPFYLTDEERRLIISALLDYARFINQTKHNNYHLEHEADICKSLFHRFNSLKVVEE